MTAHMDMESADKEVNDVAATQNLQKAKQDIAAEDAASETGERLLKGKRRKHDGTGSEPHFPASEGQLQRELRVPRAMDAWGVASTAHRRMGGERKEQIHTQTRMHMRTTKDLKTKLETWDRDTQTQTQTDTDRITQPQT